MNLHITHALFHDYSFYLSGFSYEVDTIFVCKQFILILEIKNIVGEIHFNEEKHQFIRIKQDGKFEGFRNPLDQVKRHVRALHQLIEDSLSIEYAVVFSNSKSILGRAPKNEIVFHVSGLETHVSKLLSKHVVPVNQEQYDAVVHQLKKYYSMPVVQFHLDSSKIMTGVLCSHCHYQRKMHFQHGKFECVYCHYRSNMPLREALFDDYVLIGEWMTNKAFHDYVEMDSTDIAKCLLQSLCVTCEGTNKGRRYRIADKEPAHYSNARVLSRYSYTNKPNSVLSLFTSLYSNPFAFMRWSSSG